MKNLFLAFQVALSLSCMAFSFYVVARQALSPLDEVFYSTLLLLFALAAIALPNPFDRG